MISQLQTGPDHAGHLTMCDLAVAERLIVWSFRRWVSGPEHWPLVVEEFERHFSYENLHDAVGIFARMVDVLRFRARRTIRYHQPCCPCVGQDEFSLLTLVSTAQAGEIEHARALASRLVHQDGIDPLIASATVFAEALRAEYAYLDIRTAAAPRRARPELRVVH